MIRFVTPALEPILAEITATSGIFSAKIYTQYQTYGAQSGIADFWLVSDGEQVTGALSKLAGNLTVAVPLDADIEELGAFLQAVGGSCVEGELPLIERLNTILHSECDSSWILRYAPEVQTAAASCADGVAVIGRAASLTEVYKLLCKSDAAFAAQAQYEAWLAEISHKVRHGLAEVYALYVENEIVSTTSILFCNQLHALIAGVATDPVFQGRGYARQLMAHVTAHALEQGKHPCLLAGENALAGFYEGCGYRIDGRWGRVSLVATSDSGAPPPRLPRFF